MSMQIGLSKEQREAVEKILEQCKVDYIEDEISIQCPMDAEWYVQVN